MATTFEKRRQSVGVVLLAPALVMIAGILGYPIARSALLALQDVKLRAGKLDQVWVGLANFKQIFSDKGLQHAALNTLYFSAMEVILVVGISLGVALLLNQPQGRSGALKILLVIPWAIAPVANAVLWKWILNSNYGVLNGLLKSVGLIDNYQVWLGTPFSALNFLLLVDVWKSIPFVTLLLLAGLQRVPSVLHRAAFMDGASSFQSFRYITLPAIKDAIGIAVILQTIWSLRVFDIVFVLTRGGPADGTVLLNFLAYRVTFNFLNIGYGAAIANVIFILTFILAIGYLWLLKPKSTAGAK